MDVTEAKSPVPGAGSPNRTVSVRELVRRRMGLEADPWNLALVQRAEVWDQVRMRHLLDSLLAGYPIGSILLCRVSQHSLILMRKGDQRVATEADSQSWQLLDGQQRINALFSMLTAEGSYGRFLLHMTRDRVAPGPVSRRSSKERALAHIAWAGVAKGDIDDEPIEDRERQVDLSRWFDWAESIELDLNQLHVDEANVAGILRGIDPECTAPLSSPEAAVATARLRQLIRAWTSPSIPILATEVDGPLDVLEVFTRINMGGVQVTGTDVYFAAVKTFWPEAERRLDRLSSATDFLDRLSALGFISRLASRGIGQGDLVPLNVDRLAGDRGVPLITAMQLLTDDDSLVIDRVARFSRVLSERSQLGLGLKLINARLWDEVLAWAVTSVRGDGDWFTENIPLIDAYLLGGTLFRYPAILGDRFRRAAFLEATAAGTGAEVFPLERILTVARGGNAGLHGSRQVVRGLSDIGDRLALTDGHRELLLSVAQRRPYTQTYIDWDHIFPRAGAGRMWAISESSGRRIHHPKRRLINSIGNLWALDSSTNRALQDKPPSVKFPLLDSWMVSGAGFAVWTREHWALTPQEVQAFICVDTLLTEDAASVEQGMQQFEHLVATRADRVLTETLSRFPGVQLFAADAPVGAADPTLEPTALLAESLGLASAAGIVAQQLVEDAESNAESVELVLSGAWHGRVPELTWVVKAVSKRHTAGARALPADRGNGFDFRRYFDIGQPEGAYLAIGFATRLEAQHGSLFWLQAYHRTGNFTTVRQRLMASTFAELVRSDEQGLWLPLPVTPDLEWQELADRLDTLVSEIRAVVSTPTEDGI